MNDVQKIISGMVDGPITGPELATKIVETFVRIGVDIPENIPNVLQTMVNKGMLVEVEYVLPSMEYRVKSLYFPKETVIRL